MPALGDLGTVTPLRAALTARGIAVLIGSAVTAGGGLALGYPELAALGVAGVVAVLASLGAVARAPSMRVERSVYPSRVPRGTEVHAELTVRNDTRRTSAELIARDRAGSVVRPFQIPRLRPGQVHPGRVLLPTDRRGVIMSGPLLVERDDPFGFAHRTLDTGHAEPLYVRPRPVHLPEIGASLARSVDGSRADTTMEGTLAFHALREYVPGDELRHVHWRASAHAGKYIVKQHVDTAHPALAVILDTMVVGAPIGQPDDQAVGKGEPALPTALAEAFEVAVDCAASVAVVAATHRYRLVMTDATGRPLTAGSARSHITHTVDDVLDSLTRVRAVPLELPATSAGPSTAASDPLPGTLRRLTGHGRGSLAVVISTRPMQQLAGSLQALGSSYAQVVAVHAVTGPVHPGGAARTGRVIWVTVRRAEDLATALLRTGAAA